MNKKFIYVLGSLILFFGLFYMFLPHITHNAIVEKINEEHDDSSHFENIIYGLIITLTGLAVMIKSNKKDNEKELLKNLTIILFASAAAIHLALIQEHLREWLGYGIFFIIVTIIQLKYAILIYLKEDSKKLSKKWFAIYLSGMIFNLLIIEIYIITRTIGIPFFGPGAGEIEALTPIGIFSLFVEAAAVLTSWQLIRKSSPK